VTEFDRTFADVTAEQPERVEAFVDAARNYSELGWALVRAEGKKPVGKGWERTAPEAPDLAAGKWSRWGEKYNLGVVCGPSGLAVVDVDVDDGPEQALLELLGLDELPATPIVRTGRGRLQAYFRDPGGLQKAVVDGIELRVGPHHCVAPPSVHPDTGREYRWLVGHEPWTVPPAQLPARVVEHFAARNGRHNGSAPVVGDVIPIGEIDTTLASLAGTMRRRGMSEDAICAALVTELGRCEPGHTHTEKDCRRIAKSVARYEPAIDSDPDPGPAPGAVATNGGLAFRRLADVEMRSIEWLDKPLWQRAAFHLVVGKKGSGKGTFLAGVAARASRGELFDRPVNVLIVATEDSDEVDVKPRVVAAGGDASRIFTLVGGMKLPNDAPALRAAALEIGDVGVIILDPIASLVRGDTHAEDPVRHAIDPLNALANELDCLLIGVRHLSKDTSRGALASVLGSTAWVDVPRAVLAVAADDEVDDTFHIVVAAGNRSARGGGRMFQIALADVGLKEPVTRAVEAGESGKSIDDLLGQNEPRRRAPKRDGCRTIILRELADEPKPLDHLKAACISEIGCSGETVWLAANALKADGLIDSSPNGFGGGWHWYQTSVPEEDFSTNTEETTK
jgi:hypothetical protein